MPRARSYELKAAFFGPLKGRKIYYLGFDAPPKFLPKNGRGFGGLKHLLELLLAKYKVFELTITPEEDSAKKLGTKYKVRISAKSIKRMGQRRFSAGREIYVRLANQLLHEVLPTDFPNAVATQAYRPGIFGEILSGSFNPRLLRADDSQALTKFVLGNTASSSGSVDVGTAYKITRDAQLIYLEKLVSDFDQELGKKHEESWWQSYFRSNVLYFQDSYIEKLEKLQTTIVDTQFPDFSVISADGFLDVLEIKKPATDLLKHDSSRHNYYWSIEIAKAISQTENYIDSVVRHADAIRNKLRDDRGIDLQIIKPRGIVIAGMTTSFSGRQKMADDFRRLNEGLKNVQIVAYDELSQRLKNTISGIKRLAVESQKSSARKSATPRQAASLKK